MTLVRFEPFREIDSLQRQMNRLFDDFAFPQNSHHTNGLRFIPAAELQETEDALELKLEVPGMEAKDLDIQVSAEAITISGERKSETQTEEKGITRSEFRYGHFERVIPLAVRVKNDAVTADYKDGILHITLPKAEAEKNKVVKVSVA